MGKKEKLIARLKTEPTDFTFDEVETLMSCLGYVKDNKGKTSGSRVKFVCPSHKSFLMHRPHPSSIMRPYQVKDLLTELEKEGLI